MNWKHMVKAGNLFLSSCKMTSIWAVVNGYVKHWRYVLVKLRSVGIILKNENNLFQSSNRKSQIFWLLFFSPLQCYKSGRKMSAWEYGVSPRQFYPLITGTLTKMFFLMNRFGFEPNCGWKGMILWRFISFCFYFHNDHKISAVKFSCFGHLTLSIIYVNVSAICCLVPNILPWEQICA